MQQGTVVIEFTVGLVNSASRDLSMCEILYQSHQKDAEEFLDKVPNGEVAPLWRGNFLNAV